MAGRIGLQETADSPERHRRLTIPWDSLRSAEAIATTRRSSLITPSDGAVGALITAALPLPDPNGLSPAFNHSRPITVSQPFGVCRFLACCARHASNSVFHGVAAAGLSAATAVARQVRHKASSPNARRRSGASSLRHPRKAESLPLLVTLSREKTNQLRGSRAWRRKGEATVGLVRKLGRHAAAS